MALNFEIPQGKCVQCSRKLRTFHSKETKLVEIPRGLIKLKGVRSVIIKFVPLDMVSSVVSNLHIILPPEQASEMEK